MPIVSVSHRVPSCPDTQQSIVSVSPPIGGLGHVDDSDTISTLE